MSTGEGPSIEEQRIQRAKIKARIDMIRAACDTGGHLRYRGVDQRHREVILEIAQYAEDQIAAESAND